MKPPICEVCNDRFDGSPDNLISFMVDAKTDAFDKRASQSGFVGHRPNTGWFCALHIEAAGSRAASMTLSAAIQDIKQTPAVPTVVVPERFDLRPDLQGVNVHGGVIQRSGNEGRSAIVWELTPIKNSIAVHQFLELVPVLFDQLGLGSPPALDVATRRSWNPMDGAREPDCPYTDSVRHEALRPDGRPAVSVESDQTHWDDHRISSVASRLFVNVDGGQMSAWASGSDHHDACTALTLRCPTSATVVDAVVAAFAQWLGPAAS